MESKQTSAELTLKHLWDLANVLPPENHTNKLLRSYYLTTCKKIGRRDVQLPAAKFSPSVMCPKCSSMWSDGEFSLTLKPQRFRSQKAQKLVDTLNNDPKTLTKKQRTRAKWLKKRISTSVEITCGFCQKKRLQPLLKPRNTKIKEEPKVAEEIPMKTKKKKKVKDKSAGLKLPQPILGDVKPISSQILSNSKKKKKTKQQKLTSQKGKVEKVKVVSKTQKQNSLLQLANMLKNRGTSGSSASNQLEKFLR